MQKYAVQVKYAPRIPSSIAAMCNANSIYSTDSHSSGQVWCNFTLRTTKKDRFNQIKANYIIFQTIYI